jgi:uncharacterized protein
MSATQKPGPVETQPANDPSMEDILASIRRILSEEEPAAAAAAVVPADAAVATAVEPPTLPAPEEQPNDVLVLDPSMLVEVEEQEEEVAAAPAPPPEPDSEPEPEPSIAPVAIAVPIEMPSTLLAPETEAAASTSVGNLMRRLATERTLHVHRGGPTIEDIVREELRPLLKQWLDTHLPDLVERLVQTEIERVVHRSVP